MAKKKNTDELENFNETESAGSKVVSFLIALVIVIIWLGVFALLIKMDFAGFGSKVLTPILKDVPVVNRILPGTVYTDSEGNAIDSLDEALARIQELELQLESLTNSGNVNSSYIAELEAENARLKVFEENQKDFEQRVLDFEKDVVFNDKAPGLEEYKAYYEEFDPENAALLYQQVVEQLQADESLIAQGQRFANMDPAAAAEILEVMTGDLDLVCKILDTMKAKQSAAIIAEMTPEYAAKVTKKMALLQDDAS